jgi:hypothetical protein
MPICAWSKCGDRLEDLTGEHGGCQDRTEAAAGVPQPRKRVAGSPDTRAVPIGGAGEVRGGMIDTDLDMKRVRGCGTHPDRALRVDTSGNAQDLVDKVVTEALGTASGIEAELDG